MSLTLEEKFVGRQTESPWTATAPNRHETPNEREVKATQRRSLIPVRPYVPFLGGYQRLY
eukprot:scaffold76995_cov13-Tisochrysis_lutea.AAC.1